MAPRAFPVGAFAALGAGLVVAAAFHLLIGSTWITPTQLLWGDSQSILMDIRAPRLATAILVGAALGMVGSAFQALFRNPIADPYVVGVSSGAAVGGALGLTAGLMGFGMTLAATGGGIASLMLVLALSRRHGRIETPVLLLSGVVVGSMLAAILSMVLLMSGQDSNIVLRWLLGSITPAYWERVQGLGLAAIIGGGLLLSQTRALNVLSFGEDTATVLGANVSRAKWITLGAGSTMVAVAVGSVGIIGFLGLVAPHVARRIVGVDWRWSLPASGLCGAILLTLADIGAQRILQGGEVPVGVVTAILGAPWLLALMRRPE